MKAKKTRTRRNFLSGWKAIGNYLGMGVRTVQRYEREEALPIHRVTGGYAASVVAVPAELDTWVASRPIRKDLKRRRDDISARTNKLSADFLRIDSEIALTFSGLAVTTMDEEKRKRRIQIASDAYRSIMRLRRFFDLSNQENERLDANLERLKTELRSLGEGI